MLLKELMSKQVITVAPDTTLQELAKMLKEHRVSGIPVVEDENIVGMVTLTDMLKIIGDVYLEGKPASSTSYIKPDRTLKEEAPKTIEGDVITRLQQKIANTKASDVMTTEIVALEEDATLDHLIQLMDEKFIHTFPVVKDGKIIGIVGKRDLVAVAFDF